MNTFEKNTGFYKSHDGTPIYYEVRGSGDPVIFIYGIACLINHWHHQVRHFSESKKTVVFDLRGHHRSQPVMDPQQLTMEAMGRDLVGLIEGLGLKNAHVVGHSFGAPVILEAYRQNPDVFRSLCFINGFAKNPIKGMFGLDVIEPFFYFIRSAYQQSPEMWGTIWRMAIENPVSMRLAALAGGFNLRLTHFKDVEVYSRGVAHMELSIFMALFEEMMRFNGDDILPTIKHPTLVIAGENDRVTPKHFQEDFISMIPHAEYMQVPYGSHCTQLDFPDYVNLKLAEFWERV
ncbi:MAG: alpha/beta hydrolase [Bdellovibrionaceae bacterium]|nr:alpha/beta hydrolase [Pseudobdellovibrionaceae bacterium]MBX3033679.1 alpha/beta hydrolase [Pseudobdellovibrionaceae bacterium]